MEGRLLEAVRTVPPACNWESARFNLPHAIRERIPRIDEHDTVAIMHNDAVVQGLSEIPTCRTENTGPF